MQRSLRVCGVSSLIFTLLDNISAGFLGTNFLVDTLKIKTTLHATHILHTSFSPALLCCFFLPPCRASFASVESVKAASDVYIPVAGTVKEVNKKLGDDPSLVNKSAEGDAWFAKVTIANPKDLDSLLDDAAYKAFLKSEGH
jgi:hypothetical protein